MPRRRTRIVIDVRVVMLISKKKKKEATIIIMAGEHPELLLPQEGDTHNIAIEQVDPVPILRTCENIVTSDGEEGQGSKQVVLREEDQNIMAITAKEMANQKYFVTKEMHNTMELDISIEGAHEQIESNEAKEDKKKFEEGNRVTMAVILAPITTQPIVVEKT